MKLGDKDRIFFSLILSKIHGDGFGYFIIIVEGVISIQMKRAEMSGFVAKICLLTKSDENMSRERVSHVKQDLQLINERWAMS